MCSYSQPRRKRWVRGVLLGVGAVLASLLANQWYKAHKLNQARALLAEVYAKGMYAAHLPACQFRESVFDFGTIMPGEVVEHAYTFTNTGNAPLLIHEVVAGCCSDCATAVWPKQPVQVGESGTIQVRLNSTKQPGQLAQVIAIRANTDPPEVRLLLKGVVAPQK